MPRLILTPEMLRKEESQRDLLREKIAKISVEIQTRQKVIKIAHKAREQLNGRNRREVERATAELIEERDRLLLMLANS